MRTRIVAANWKMNKAFGEADDLLYNVVNKLQGLEKEGQEVVICPPFPYLEMATDVAAEHPVRIGAQNVSQHESGAYTGEVSAIMLRSMDVSFVIIGHSERRKHFGETDEVLAAKVNRVLTQDMSPIFCCGELLDQREAGKHKDIVRDQLEKGLFHLSEEDIRDVVIAYEPVWAIGTGVTATTDQAQEMHAMIREMVSGKYGGKIADEQSILYGGSCNAGNAAELFALPDVDGGLIGGASLKAEEFVRIVQSLPA